MSGQIKYEQTNLLYTISIENSLIEFVKENESGQFSALIISTAYIYRANYIANCHKSSSVWWETK